MYARTEARVTGTITGDETINHVVGIDDGRYLTTLKFQNKIKIWFYNENQLSSADIYIHIPVELLNGKEVRKEVVLGNEPVMGDFLIDYVTQFTNGLILLKTSDIPNSRHMFLCLLNTTTLNRTFIKIEKNTNYILFNSEHFMTLLHSEEHYNLYLWKLDNIKPVKKNKYIEI